MVNTFKSLRPKCVTALAMLAGPVVASAQSITYDFSGTVTDATGIYASAGGTIVGTFTFDIDADPAQSSGSIGSTTTSWYSQSYGGIGDPYGGRVPSSLVFSSTLTSGAVTYSTTPANDASYSIAEAYESGSSQAPNTYHAADVQYSTSNMYISSSFILFGGTGSNAPFDANGLPVFGDSVSGSGILFSGIPSGELDYAITSMALASAPAPEIDPTSAASGLALLIGGIAVVRGRRPRGLTA